MNGGKEKATSENSSETADVIFPSEVSTKLSVFDRFATYVSARTSQAWFFVVCVIIVVLWAPSFFLLGTIDTWQLTINTVTFLESSGSRGRTIESGARHTITRKQSSEESVASGTAIPARSPD
jgi:hypothetical protein